LGFLIAGYGKIGLDCKLFGKSTRFANMFVIYVRLYKIMVDLHKEIEKNEKYRRRI